jgi:hypothetical protein
MNPNIDVLKFKFNSISNSVDKLHKMMKNKHVDIEIKKNHMKDLCRFESSVDDLYVHVNNLLFIAEDVNEKNKTYEPIPYWFIPLIFLSNMKNDTESILNQKDTNELIDLDGVD